MEEPGAIRCEEHLCRQAFKIPLGPFNFIQSSRCRGGVNANHQIKLSLPKELGKDLISEQKSNTLFRSPSECRSSLLCF